MDHANQFMDSALYNAAMVGNIEVLRQHTDQFGHQLTPRSNTVLHVAAQFQDNRECVNIMLTKEPSLLRWVNSKGETALHIAARRGCSVTVKELLAFAKSRADPESNVAVTKELLWMETSEKDTALHEAVRNNHLGVVELLLREDPDLYTAAANSAGETPLYLAAERHHHDIVLRILETGRNPPPYGPSGRTALHAAVIARCPDCVKKLLDKDPDLIKIGDSYGWTPLHFAVYFNSVVLTKLLLDTDKSIAYLAANEGGMMTALHLGAKRCSFDAMQELWLSCPDCWEMVNENGQNVFHIAIENDEGSLVKLILNSSISVNNLLNEKDRDGNTPLHLLATSHGIIPELISHPATDKGAFNKNNQTPLDMIYPETWNEKRKELLEANAPRGWRNIVSDEREEANRLKKIKSFKKESKEESDEYLAKFSSIVILVATLVATVTFTASFTVPGGFDSNQGPNQGMAVLVRKAAFKAFVISNTIAVTSSISSVILLLFSTHYNLAKGIDPGEWPDKATRRFASGWYCLVVSLFAMMVSLITGSFAVLATSMGLAVVVCAIGCVGLLIFCVLLIKYFRDVLSYLFS